MHLVLVARQPTCKGGGLGSVGRTREMLSSQPWCWIDHLDEARRGRLATLAASINGRGDDEGDLVRHGADRRHEWNTRWRIAGHSFYHLADHVYDNWSWTFKIQEHNTASNMEVVSHQFCCCHTLLMPRWIPSKNLKEIPRLSTAVISHWGLTDIWKILLDKLYVAARSFKHGLIMAWYSFIVLLERRSNYISKLICKRILDWGWLPRGLLLSVPKRF